MNFLVISPNIQFSNKPPISLKRLDLFQKELVASNSSVKIQSTVQLVGLKRICVRTLKHLLKHSNQ